MKIRFLGINLEEGLATSISSYLGSAYEFEALSQFSSIREVLRERVVDAFIVSSDDLSVCKEIKTWCPTSDVLLVVNSHDDECVRFVNEYDIDEVLVEPVSFAQIRFCLLRIIHRFKDNPDYELDTIKDDLGIVGGSEYIQRIRQQVLQVAPGEFPVLIQGDSGTGKEVVAKAIHAHSRRKGKALVVVNCGAITKTLEESEFFGHIKGAFTGALMEKEGFFSLANGSTMFLDEIGEISLETQVKLLRVLDSGEYMRIGDPQVRTTNIRIISATNRDMEKMVAEKQFREDLYYRIRGITIHTKPLREHKEDIPELVHYFLDLQGDKRVPRRFTHPAMRFLLTYNWPGNVRELKHTIDFLSTAHLGSMRIDAAIKSFLRIKDDERASEQSYAQAKETLLRDFDMHYFTSMLQKHRGNVAAVARFARMYRPNVMKKLNALGIDPEKFRIGKSDE